MTTKVLIVDDSALTRRSLRQILEAAGCDVVEAEDGLSRAGALLPREAGRGACSIW